MLSKITLQLGAVWAKRTLELWLLATLVLLVLVKGLEVVVATAALPTLKRLVSGRSI